MSARSHYPVIRDSSQRANVVLLKMDFAIPLLEARWPVHVALNPDAIAAVDMKRWFAMKVGRSLPLIRARTRIGRILSEYGSLP